MKVPTVKPGLYNPKGIKFPASRQQSHMERTVIRRFAARRLDQGVRGMRVYKAHKKSK